VSVAVAEKFDGTDGAEGEDISSSASERPSSDERVASERLCVGCRRTVPREELVRFAIADVAPYVVPDPQRKLGGRGASVHPTRECIQLAVKKGGFARAAKKSVTIDAAALWTSLARLYEQRSDSLLIAASRRNMLVIGTDAVREALRPSEKTGEVRIEVLVVASDAEGRREELEAGAARMGRRCCVIGTKNSLGRLFGRDEVGVLGILDSRIGDEVVRCAEIVSGLCGSRAGETDAKAAGRAVAE